jgi:uncharacterized cupin superfamily protein
MLPQIVASRTDVELEPAPIEPSWIVEGTPLANSAELSSSEDGRATTILWECTAGRFNWAYDYDETAYIIAGSVIIQSETMKPTRFSHGDVVFFRRGARATWHVEDYIRKLAFVRNPDDSLSSKIIRRIRRGILDKRITSLTGPAA